MPESIQTTTFICLGLVLENPKEAKDSQGCLIRWLLSEINLVFRANFSQHVVEDLEEGERL